MLHITDLVDIISLFPEARQKLRWAQVSIAILRGVKRISTALKELSERGELNFDELSDEERMDFYADILQCNNYTDNRDGTRVEKHWDAEALMKRDPSIWRLESQQPIPDGTPAQAKPISTSREHRGLECWSVAGASGSSSANVDTRALAEEYRASIMVEFREVTTELRSEVASLNEKVDRLLADDLSRVDEQNANERKLSPLGLRPLGVGITQVGNRARDLTGAVIANFNHEDSWHGTRGGAAGVFRGRWFGGGSSWSATGHTGDYGSPRDC